MGPNSSESLQLPEPMPEQSINAVPQAESVPGKAEKASSPEKVNQAGSVQPPALPTIPLPAPPVASIPTPQAAALPAQDNPAQASDDADRIEKSWVIKAKQIVESTRNDPYKQSEELSLFKADYMKKRYNRTVKVSK